MARRANRGGLGTGALLTVGGILAAALTVALLVTHYAGGPGTIPGPGAGRMRQVLRIWLAFPANSTPRPLVLTAPPVADPASGFRTGNAKEKYLEGVFALPAALPSGPAAADGFPLITAQQATGILRSQAAKGPPVAGRIAVTRVHLGTAVFQTDRGQRRLPAWLFRLAGARGPAGVLAVAPGRIFTQPGHPDVEHQFVGSAMVGRYGRTLTLRFVGAAAGTGPCTANYTATQAASSTAVVVSVTAHTHGGGSVPCASVGYIRHATVTLAVPLGGRVLVDAASGAALAVTTGP